METIYGVPPEPQPVSREEGQCGWCYFRTTDICGANHDIEDHCVGMGHRGLECSDYLWVYSSNENIASHRGKLTRENRCKCQTKTFYAKIFMQLFRWYEDRHERFPNLEF